MASTPVRGIFIDMPASEAYSLESVGKHGFSKRFEGNHKWFSMVLTAGRLTPQP